MVKFKVVRLCKEEAMTIVPTDDRQILILRSS
jgi:hypothetical protein